MLSDRLQKSIHEEGNDNFTLPSSERTCVVMALLMGLLLSSLAFMPAASGSSIDSVSGLVDKFEHHAQFRGIRNGQLPSDLGSGLKLGVLTVYPGVSSAGVLRDGYVDFGALVDGTRVIAASDGAGMDRFALIIDGPGSATEFRFPVVLPLNATQNNLDTGAVEVHSTEGDTILAPALAVDASGKQISARYRILNGILVINVDLSSAELPVMVDPASANYWWGFTDWYSRGEVRQAADWYGAVKVAKVVCTKAGLLKKACDAVISKYTNWISNTWQEAKRNNQCVSMSVTWTGQVTKIRRYNCNWG